MSVCTRVYKHYFDNIIKFTGSIGCLLNLLSIVVFLHPKIKGKINGHMYKYLTIKSVADFYFCFKNSMAPIFRCEAKCVYSTFYVSKLLSLGFYYYLGHICEFMSMFFQLAANFDRYFIILRRYKFYSSKIFFYGLLTGSILFSFTFYSYTLHEQTISLVESKNSTSYYIIRYNRLHWSLLGKSLRTFNIIIRDGILVVLLLLIDIFTLIKLKKSMELKRLLLGQNEILLLVNSNVRSLLKADKSEKNITIMVLVDGILHVIVHSLLFFYHTHWDYIYLNDCYKLSMKLLLDMTKTSGFFIYIIFNKQFRMCFKMIFLNIFNCNKMSVNY